MIALSDKNTGKHIGELSEHQLRFLIAELEEEGLDDKDYWVHVSQVESFEKKGIDPELTKLLRKALGDNDEVEIVWKRL